MALGDYDTADSHNNEAIMLDPDYIASYVIKCLIYEDTCEYSMCQKMARWALEKCDPDENEEDEALIEQLQDILAGIVERLPNEMADKAAYFKAKEEGSSDAEKAKEPEDDWIAEVLEDYERTEVEGDEYLRKKYRSQAPRYPIQYKSRRENADKWHDVD